VTLQQRPPHSTGERLPQVGGYAADSSPAGATMWAGRQEVSGV